MPVAIVARRMSAMAVDLAEAFRGGSRVERLCYLVGFGLVGSGVFHLAVLLVTGGSWVGPLSWRKPTTFGLSFGLTLVTITWVLSLMPIPRRPRSAVLSVFAAACVIEVAVITTQAWRRQPAHFGTADGAMGMGLVAALGGVAVISSMVAAAALTWRWSRSLPASMRLALRIGFLSFLVTLGLGALMLARGMVLSRVQGDVAGAFAFAAGIKPGHAATMHGVLVLPALAWVLRYTGRHEHFRTSVMRVACGGYLTFAGVVVAESLVGIDPFDVRTAPPVATALLLLGLLVLLGAGIVTLRALAINAPQAGGQG